MKAIHLDFLEILTVFYCYSSRLVSARMSFGVQNSFVVDSSTFEYLPCLSHIIRNLPLLLILALPNLKLSLLEFFVLWHQPDLCLNF